MKTGTNQAVERYLDFLATIPELRNKEFESTHWGKAIADFQAHEYDTDFSNDEFAYYVAKSEFGFRAPSWPRLAKDIFWAYVVSFITRWTLFLTDSRGGKYEHARAIAFLKRRNLYRSYMSFIKRFGIGSDMQTIRHYHYARVLSDALSTASGTKTVDTILEIGAGAGNFAVFAFALLQPRCYIIVDLPQMLAYSGYQILKHVPDVTVIYPYEYSPDKLQGPGPKVLLLTPSQIENLPNDIADVMLNFTSFSEMDREEVDRYIQQVYRVGKPDSVFYNVNRWKIMKDRMGGEYIQNPFLFPYKSNDEILSLGLDTFHHETRGGFGVIPSLTMTRIARLKK